MKVSLSTPGFKGTVRAVASKSVAHRYFICAALSGSPTHISCEEVSKDMEATLDCLVKMGAGAEADSDGFTIYPVGWGSPGSGMKNGGGAKRLDCGESGSTLRFLLPVIGALGMDASLTLRGRLAERPLSPLYEQLAMHGCILSEQGSSPLSCSGQLCGGDYEIAGNISSQFISGLLFALPLLETDSTLRVNGRLESAGYVDMTLDAVRTFGIEVAEERSDEAVVYRLKGGQRYRTPGDLRVEGDWSNAAFWLCAGAINGDITCTNLNISSRQGDRQILDILRRFGAKVEIRPDGAVHTESSSMKGIELDAADIPDLVMAAAAAASLSEGETVIKNASRLRLKESDRLAAVSRSLAALGADISETEDGLIIKGKRRLDGGCVDSCGDHRIAMMEAIVSAGSSGPVTVDHAEAVEKSYPAFYCDYIELGGRVRRVD